MPSTAALRRDPALAALLSAVVPGGGLFYADETRAGAIVLGTETALILLGWWLPLLVLHGVQIGVAAGTARVAGERHRDVLAGREDTPVTEGAESPAPPA